MKKCSSCQTIKNVEEFHKKKSITRVDIMLDVEIVSMNTIVEETIKTPLYLSILLLTIKDFIFLVLIILLNIHGKTLI